MCRCGAGSGGHEPALVNIIAVASSRRLVVLTIREYDQIIIANVALRSLVPHTVNENGAAEHTKRAQVSVVTEPDIVNASWH